MFHNLFLGSIYLGEEGPEFRTESLKPSLMHNICKKNTQRTQHHLMMMVRVSISASFGRAQKTKIRQKKSEKENKKTEIRKEKSEKEIRKRIQKKQKKKKSDQQKSENEIRKKEIKTKEIRQKKPEKRTSEKLKPEKMSENRKLVS